MLPGGDAPKVRNVANQQPTAPRKDVPNFGYPKLRQGLEADTL